MSDAYNPPYVYVCFDPGDKDVALSYIVQMQQKGLRVFYNQDPLMKNEDIERISHKILLCDCFIALLTERCKNSKMCIREINYAISVHKEPLAVFLESFEVSAGLQMQLGSMQAIYRDRYEDEDEFLEDLLAADVMIPCRDMDEESYLNYGMVLYRNQRYKEAVMIFEKAASLGTGLAQFMLGNCYERGLGVWKDDEAARQWFEKAAESGYEDAIITRALQYYYGVGEHQNITKAQELLSKIARKNQEAMEYYVECKELADVMNHFKEENDAAVILEAADDFYSEAKYVQAYYLYHKAAEFGNVVAQNRVAHCWELGRGTAKVDDAKALYWYTKAAEQGDKLASYKMSSFYRLGKGVEKNPGLALELLQKSANDGFCQSQFELTLYRMSGDFAEESRRKMEDILLGIGEQEYDEEDAPKIKEMLVQAAEQSHLWAMMLLGICYELGYGPFEQNLEKARAWYQKTKENGLSIGSTGCQRLLDYQEQVWENYVDQFAEDDLPIEDMCDKCKLPEYCFKQGMTLLKTTGDTEVHAVIGWFKLAAALGSLEGQYYMGLLREYYSKDPKRARYWYALAQQNGHMEAKQDLERCLDKLQKRPRFVTRKSEFQMELPEAYEGKESYIFVSYAHKDSELVLPMLAELVQKGYHIWYDGGIGIGTEWPEYIASHLRDSSGVLAFVSRHSIGSNNCQREISYATLTNKDVLVLYLEDVYPKSGIQMLLSGCESICLKDFADKEELIRAIEETTMMKLCSNLNVPQTVSKEAVANYEQGRMLYEERKFKEAFPWILNAAKEGCQKAQELLGNMYIFALGIPRDEQEAKKWLDEATANKTGEEQYKLASSYLEGAWLSTDAQRAIYWLIQSGEKGYAPAYYKLGTIYESGKIMPCNYELAARYYKQAALLGYADAYYKMGVFHERGIGVTQDLEEAIRYYRMDGTKGESQTKAGLSRCQEIVNSNMSAEDCFMRAEQFYGTHEQDALQQAFCWYYIAAVKGDARAQYCLGYCYEYAEGTEFDYEKAVEWYRKASYAGQESALEALEACVAKNQQERNAIAKLFTV